MSTLAKAKMKAPAGRDPRRARAGQEGAKTGLVAALIHARPGGLGGEAKRGAFSPPELIERIQNGLAVHELEVLQQSLAVPMERLAPKLGISRATWQRRKAGGRLGREESDRVVRFARLMGKAVEVLEGETDARRWLSAPQIGLGGAVPLDYAETEVGAREVEDLLGRIEYGVYA